MNKPISAALISVAGTMLSDGERRLIEQYSPLGVSLFARNIESRSQLAELTRQIREAAEDENIIIAVDQEGGRVRRLAEPEFRPYASQYVLGKIGETYGQEEAEKAVYEHVLLISKDLKDCGINMNFAPVLDLAFESRGGSALIKGHVQQLELGIGRIGDLETFVLQKLRIGKKRHLLRRRQHRNAELSLLFRVGDASCEQFVCITLAFVLPRYPEAIDMHVAIRFDRTPRLFGGDVLDEHLAAHIELPKRKPVGKPIGHPGFFGCNARFALLFGYRAADVLVFDVFCRYGNDFH